MGCSATDFTRWLVAALLFVNGCGSSTASTAATDGAAIPSSDAGNSEVGLAPDDDASAEDASSSAVEADAAAADDAALPSSFSLATFSVEPNPVLEGQFAIPFLPFVPAAPFSGDACVIAVPEGYRMYHTCYATDRSGTDTCLAISADGVHWTLPDTGDPQSLGRVLRSDVGAWDAAHETPFAIRRGTEIWLYAVGYRPPSAGFLGADSIRLARATSSDGLSFGATEGPLFEPLPDSLDDHGLTSPSLVEHEGELWLIYTGWCIDAARCPRAAQERYTAQLGARSHDGVNWVRHERPVLLDTDLTWAADGVAETHVVHDPDSGLFLLFFQALSANAPHAVGVGWARHPFGPYTLHPSPVLTAEDLPAWGNGGVVAPHALFVSGELWLYFSGEQRDAAGKTQTFRVGMARAPRPFLR